MCSMRDYARTPARDFRRIHVDERLLCPPPKRCGKKKRTRVKSAAEDFRRTSRKKKKRTRVDLRTRVKKFRSGQFAYQGRPKTYQGGFWHYKVKNFACGALHGKNIFACSALHSNKIFACGALHNTKKVFACGPLHSTKRFSDVKVFHYVMRRRRNCFCYVMRRRRNFFCCELNAPQAKMFFTMQCAAGKNFCTR